MHGGCSAVLVTHDATHAAWADRVLCLRDGRFAEAGRDALIGSGSALERARRKRADAAARRSRLGDGADDGLLVGRVAAAAGAACGALPVGSSLRAPLRADARVLFVSGSLDARTPPSNVDELLGGFPNAAHIVADNAGHESIELLSSEYRELLARFLAGERVESRTIALPPPRFRTL